MYPLDRRRHTRSSFGSTVSDRRNWVTPIVFDPNNPAIMYYGGNRVNRSTNSAATWTVISPDLTRGNGGVGGAAFGTVTTLAVARSNSQVIYAGTDDGRVWITRNTGGTWTEITAGLPTRWITRIEVDPANADMAYVSVSGYRNGDPGAHVFRTTTGGTSWQDISAGLPDAPVNDLVLDPRNPAVLYAASDVGVFARAAAAPGRRSAPGCRWCRSPTWTPGRRNHHGADRRHVRPGLLPHHHELTTLDFGDLQVAGYAPPMARRRLWSMTITA